MIAKKYRLSEKEIRKVFREKKPFFSSGMIANVQKNTVSHARIAILLSGKHTPGSVNRNAFRRILYHHSYALLSLSVDIVIVLKKWTTLSHKNPQDIVWFQQNISELFQKILSSHYE